MLRQSWFSAENIIQPYHHIQRRFEGFPVSIVEAAFKV